MNVVPLITALLIIAAITTQVLAFFVTFRIRRNSAMKEENVLDFADYKDRLDKNETLPEKQVQEPFNE